jgi:hypothetical protein
MVKKRPSRTGRFLLPGFLGVFAITAVALLALHAKNGANLAQALPEDPNHVQTVLSACSGSTLLFPRIKLNALEYWSATYHQNVSTVVNAVSAPAMSDACSLTPVQPPTVMLALASQLPPWNDPERLLTLRRDDVGNVLLEYLRTYECALEERAMELPIRSNEELNEQAKQNGETPTGINLSQATTEEARQLKFIQKEMQLSRPALHRTLLFLASTMRLGSLGREMDCLTRASADLRNSLGLAAETSACVNRIWDARSALRNSTKDNNSKE